MFFLIFTFSPLINVIHQPEAYRIKILELKRFAGVLI